jgi:hypothetical protein
MNSCPDWRLLRIDRLIPTVGFWIAEIMVGRVKQGVAMRFVNECNETTIVLNPKTIIWQLIGW